mgnify:CR=1 FL=1
MGKKICVVFPGIGYHTDKPLLYYSKKYMIAHGYDIVDVTYGKLSGHLPEEIQKVSSDCYDMVGTAAFDDVMEALGKEYHGEVDYDTIGGFVMDLLGHVPEDNEKVTVHWENVEFKVLSIHEKKIERLRAVIKRDNEEVTD